MSENFIIETGKVEPNDRKHLFGFEKVQYLPIEARMPDVMVQAGIFPSKSQARKNGWDKDIPWGFSEYEHVGKYHRHIAIWKPSKSKKDYESTDL